jgi:hypothetical protein
VVQPAPASFKCNIKIIMKNAVNVKRKIEFA